jgi:hypothetical protein
LHIGKIFDGFEVCDLIIGKADKGEVLALFEPLKIFDGFAWGFEDEQFKELFFGEFAHGFLDDPADFHFKGFVSNGASSLY